MLGGYDLLMLVWIVMQVQGLGLGCFVCVVGLVFGFCCWSLWFAGLVVWEDCGCAYLLTVILQDCGLLVAALVFGFGFVDWRCGFWASLWFAVRTFWVGFDCELFGVGWWFAAGCVLWASGVWVCLFGSTFDFGSCGEFVVGFVCYVGFVVLVGFVLIVMRLLLVLGAFGFLYLIWVFCLC